jgi:NADPH-dependent 2,4-dienoyl-CoA reductase/sulfur reductase-like enzyme
VIGDEPELPYDRPPLSKQVLAGQWEEDKLPLRRDERAEFEMRLGTRATGLDVAARRLTLSDGDRMAFDGLVIATGARPRTIPGTPPLEGLHTLRTLDDCRRLRKAFARRPRVIVIGAGFIGSEVAATARGLGLEVTVLEALPVPLSRALGEEMGALCGQLHLDHGTDLRLGIGVSGFRGTKQVEGLMLADGTIIEAEVVVVGVGVAPVTGWLEGSGLTVNDGVVCDDRCRALGGDGAVVAAGDVARWHHPTFGSLRVEHWTNAVEQATAAATGLLKGDEAPPFAPIPYFWSDQYDTKIQYVGHADPADEVTVVEGDVTERRFVAAYGRGGRMTAALAFNRPSRIMAYRAMIGAGAAFPPQV